MKLPKVTLLILVFLLYSNLIQSQVTIQGIVTDVSGNPVSGALVEIINEDDTLQVSSSYTENNGSYTITISPTGIEDNSAAIPNDHIILRNYPNPFNPSTIIYFEIPIASEVEISIFDILGREIKTLPTKFYHAGIGRVIWDATNNQGKPTSAGIYFCRLKTAQHSKVHKMILVDGGGSSYSGDYSFASNGLKKMWSTAELHQFTMRISAVTFAIREIDGLICSQDTTINITVYRSQSDIIGTSGGIIETDGFLLNIPQGALSEDTEITLTPFFGGEMHNDCISAINLEPNGLFFEKPVELRMPLPTDWPEDHHPLVFVSFSSEPDEYFNTGISADIFSTIDGAFAQTDILHFSNYGTVGNCHKGTLVFLANNFEKRDCDSSSIWQKVNDKFPDVETDFKNKTSYSHNAIQAFLGTYFKDMGGFNKGQSSNPKWNEIVDYVKTQNKRVVVTFAKDNLGTKDSKGFFNFVPHSATIEIKDGKLKLRNSVEAKEPILNALTEKNGDNVMWYPEGDAELTAENLDLFRNMKTFEALENSLGEYNSLFSHLPPISKRTTQPWTAVEFYVANHSDETSPCNPPVIGSWEGIVDLSWGWCILKINTDKWIVDTPDDGSFEFPVSLWNEEAQFAILYGYDDGVADGTPYKKFAWEFDTEYDRPAINLYFYRSQETLEDAILSTDIRQQSYLQWIGD